MKRRPLKKLLFVLLFLSVSACSKKNTAESQITDAQPIPQDKKVASVSGIRGGTLVLSVPVNPTSFNPLFVTDANTSTAISPASGSLLGYNLETLETELSLAKSLKAGIVGFIAVALFAILYYRLPGLVAVVALGFYSILSLAIFRIIGVTLTLSGIAGFILSVGMAVDANVLVFERLKEELRWGKSLRLACEEAFVRAWPSIRDSNITTLISCGILIWFGVGFVQGFAVTLAIGVLVSMFTAITVTRALLRAVNRMYKKDEANILFLGHRKIAAESKES